MMSKKIFIEWLNVLVSITTILGFFIVYCQLSEINNIDRLKFTIEFIDKFYSTPQPSIDNRTISEITVVDKIDIFDKDNISDLLGNYFIQLENCLTIKKCEQGLFSLEYKANLIEFYDLFCKYKRPLLNDRRNQNGEKVARLMEKFYKELIDSKILRYRKYPNGLPKGCAL